ncbi:MAG: hypothetical protein ABII82_03710 [Verrucomicrobiota bacterium]
MQTHSRHPRARRGSVLLVSLIFSAIIAISIGSFLKLATNATRTSYRTYDLGVAMNIAETGLERAMWSINRANAGLGGAWNGWTLVSAGDDDYRRSFDLGTFENGATGTVKIYARDTSSTPVLIARAIVTPTQGRPIEKWITVSLARRTGRAIGGLGRRGIYASGNNVEFASWNSDPDNDPSTPYVPFSDSVKNDQASIATLELDAELNSGQADVNGSAAVGSNNTNSVKIGPQGYIGPFGTPNGTIAPGAVSTDFSTDLTVESAPAATYTNLGTVNNDLTLPRGGDTPAADGIYYYDADGISLNNKELVVAAGADVVIRLDNVLDDISVGGGDGGIVVEGEKDPDTNVITAGTLKIYTAGDISIAGKGAANRVSWTETTTTTQTVTTRVRVGNKWVNQESTQEVVSTETITQVGQPKNFHIYGTRTNEQVDVSGYQDFNISGNGSLSGIVYAPNADISAKGGGNAGFVMGSLVGNTLTFTGNDGFYYDESLSDDTSGGRFGIDSWREYVSYADRATFGPLMDF